jgi:hypothetical protein
MFNLIIFKWKIIDYLKLAKNILNDNTQFW